MDSKLLAAKLAEIEEQIRVLRAQIKASDERPRKFADLYGIWRGKSNFTYEEIKAAEYQIKADDF
jgi:hypothetical protein